MAIKSKSFLRSKGLKAICVLLVLALTGVCMLSVCQAVDLANHLGGRSLESILQETDGDFTSSSMFQQLLAKNLYYMHQMAFVYHSEEAVRETKNIFLLSILGQKKRLTGDNLKNC